MKVSLHWLQTYFEEPLPSAALIEEGLTFHSCEVEEVILVGDDTVFDLKVLPDKSAWLLSHRGVAKELSVIFSLPLKADPLESVVSLPAVTANIAVEFSPDSSCDYYCAIKMQGITVGPSPDWLKTRLEAVGQRSINNLVDATNYVMLDLGQPLHAFAAAKIMTGEEKKIIGVRQATLGEKFTTLTGEICTLNEADTLITNADNNEALALAGVKGGQAAAVDETTTEIILESAHFNRQAVRLTARRLNLLTDAAKRYENGVSAGLVPIGLMAAAKLIGEVAGGHVVGFACAGKLKSEMQSPVKVTLIEVNSLLGLTLTLSDVEAIIRRFGYAYEIVGAEFIVTAPFERDDLMIAADLVEEIGRVAGLHNIEATPPMLSSTVNSNKRYQYSSLIRRILVELGFSEVYTSSFRSRDLVKIENALASDKGYLRSGLSLNLAEARERNLPHRDLLGVPAIKLFEMGTVFLKETEQVMVALAVQTGTEYKAKIDDLLLAAAKAAIEEKLGVINWLQKVPGVAEFSLDELLPSLPDLANISLAGLSKVDSRYKPASLYPAMSRDIALWVKSDTTVATVEELLRSVAGEWCVRVTHLDTFIKDGRTSLAFRLVFLSDAKTLTDEEVGVVMNTVYLAVAEAGFAVR